MSIWTISRRENLRICTKGRKGCSATTRRCHLASIHASWHPWDFKKDLMMETQRFRLCRLANMQKAFLGILRKLIMRERGLNFGGCKKAPHGSMHEVDQWYFCHQKNNQSKEREAWGNEGIFKPSFKGPTGHTQKEAEKSFCPFIKLFSHSLLSLSCPTLEANTIFPSFQTTLSYNQVRD